MAFSYGSDFEGDEWLVSTGTFSTEDDPSSYFSRDDEAGGSDFEDDDDLPGSPVAEARGSEKVKKSAIEKELEKLASLKLHPPPCAVTEEEFESTYGLPNKGKNPHKLKPPVDILDKEVTDVFGYAKGRKGRAGYHYADCKDQDVLNRICEIFPLVYLRDIPRSKMIAKQFARGIVMEVLKKKPVSWAEFAANSNKNQRSKWFKKVMLSLKALGKLTGKSEDELFKEEGIHELFHDPKARSFVVPKPLIVVKEEVLPNQHSSVEELLGLMKLVAMQLHVVSLDCLTINKLKAELVSNVSHEEGVLRRTQEKIARMHKVHTVLQKVQSVPTDVQVVSDADADLSKKEEVYQEMLKDANLDYETAVTELNSCSLRCEDLLGKQSFLRKQLDALVFQLTHSKRGESGITMRPTPHCSVFDPNGTLESNLTIVMQPCAFCLSNFPLNDIVVSSCGHLYHPWCAASWFRLSSTCANIGCGTLVHPAWFRSFGFGQLHAPLQELATTLELEKEHKTLLGILTERIRISCPEVDPEKILQEQIQQALACASTQSAGGTAIIGSASLGGSFTGCGGPESPGNKWRAPLGDELKVQGARHPLRSKPITGLTSIQEVDSPDKVRDVGVDKAEVEDGINAAEDIGGGGVIEMVVGATKGDEGEPSTNVSVELELADRIKKLKEEAAEYESIRALRQEAAVLERLKQMREEADGEEFDIEAAKRTKLPRAVLKVAPLPIEPPIHAEAPSKRKTRSEMAAEAKEAEEAKKKGKRSKKTQRP